HDTDRPGAGGEDGTGGDLRARVRDGDRAAARGLRVLDAGEDRPVLGQQRAAELRDDAVAPVEEPRDGGPQQVGVVVEGRGDLVGAEVHRQAAADVEGVDLAAPDPL